MYKSDVQKRCPKVTSKSCIHKWHTKVTSKSDAKCDVQKCNPKSICWISLVLVLISPHVKRLSVSCTPYFNQWYRFMGLHLHSAEGFCLQQRLFYCRSGNTRIFRNILVLGHLRCQVETIFFFFFFFWSKLSY